MWPVIVRELQAEARHSSTYWLRILGAGALLLVGAYLILEGGLSINKAVPLFARLHLTLFCSIWILVPLVTADCISRERREGTLGLLFLTPLTARGIVMAKGLAHGLRAMTMCLAVLPVLMIPLLMGGVSWQEAALSVTTNFSLFCWALAAGLLASSWTKVWLRALLLASALAALFGLLFALVNSLLILLGWLSYTRWGSIGSINGEAFLYGAFVVTTNVGGGWKELFASIPKAGQAGVLWAAGGMAVISLAGLVVILQIAARNVGRHWQEEPPSARRMWWERTFCTPVLAVNFFRRWMRWKLDRNPIGWLEQRTWSARLVTWSWLAIMISLLSLGVGEVNSGFRGGGFYKMESLFGWLLAGSMAMSAAGSFRRERESGVLELLLVSPLRVSEIISGRLRGLWGQFLPAIALLFATWLYLESVFGQSGEGAAKPILFFAVTFTILPVVGLYYSLRESNFLNALVRTLVVGVLLPLVLGGIAGLWMTTDGSVEIWTFNFVTIISQIVVAQVLRSRLHENLSHRRFAFQRGRG